VGVEGGKTYLQKGSRVLFVKISQWDYALRDIVLFDLVFGRGKMVDLW
jgi:hypothetical protein